MKNFILVLNCGSSSIKFALYQWQESGKLIAQGLAERLDSSAANLKIKGEVNHQQALENGASHEQALEAILEALKPWQDKLIGIGHRIVHGGEEFKQSQLIDNKTLEKLEKISVLAPLHNPVNLLGVRTCQKLMPELPQVAVFDTSFHQSMPETAYLYGVPIDWYEQDKVRRYGFHGTSFRYITQEAIKRLNLDKNNANFLIAHLGNGCSACAVKSGKSVDTSMGMTPLEGFVMGTRSGSIDPGIFSYISESRNLSLQEINQILNKESGLKGVSGISNDMRSLMSESEKGNKSATRAIELFCYHAARQMAALSTSLERIDAVIFTGGIGENSADIRYKIIENWKILATQIDSELNEKHGNEQGFINQPGGTKVMVIATNEELMIAQDTFEITQI